jgi:hypothetical protein
MSLFPLVLRPVMPSHEYATGLWALSSQRDDFSEDYFRKSSSLSISKLYSLLF